MSNDRPPGFVAHGAADDPRTAREAEALAEIEAQLADGSISAEDADRMALELVLEERFGFLPPDALEELRQAGLELLDEPELVETRAYAAIAPDGSEETEGT